MDRPRVRTWEKGLSLTTSSIGTDGTRPDLARQHWRWSRSPGCRRSPPTPQHPPHKQRCSRRRQQMGPAAAEGDRCFGQILARLLGNKQREELRTKSKSRWCALGEPAAERSHARLASGAARSTTWPLPLHTAAAPSVTHLSDKLSAEIANQQQCVPERVPSRQRGQGAALSSLAALPAQALRRAPADPPPQCSPVSQPPFKTPSQAPPPLHSYI